MVGERRGKERKRRGRLALWLLWEMVAPNAVIAQA